MYLYPKQRQVRRLDLVVRSNLEGSIPIVCTTELTGPCNNTPRANHVATWDQVCSRTKAYSAITQRAPKEQRFLHQRISPEVTLRDGRRRAAELHRNTSNTGDTNAVIVVISRELGLYNIHPHSMAERQERETFNRFVKCSQ